MERVRLTDPYTMLAAGYDLVMAHVDYEAWADFVDTLVGTHKEDAAKVVELGCGTGSFAVEMARLGYDDYLATDISERMLEVARRKARAEGVDIDFERLDFSDFQLQPKPDLLLLLYDGLNYLLEDDEVRGLLASAERSMPDEGIFIVDQSTPSNSLQNRSLFDDSGKEGGFRYERHSRYDPETRLHTTTLDLFIDGRPFRETHVQKAYEMEEVRAMIDAAGLAIVAAYDGFSLDSANAESERVHWVLRRRHEVSSR